VPVIAITPCNALHDYEEAVRRAGGEPKVLDYGRDPPAEVVRSVAGVLLTGGGDVLPAMYGETAHPSYSAAEAGRDDYELELVRRAVAGDLPLFAICRGVQVLNVALAGTLVQDLPSAIDGAVAHDVPEPRVGAAHDVWIAPGTLLDRLMRPSIRGDPCSVNSRHHQAVAALGRGLVVTATAPDGVIEAVEDPSKRFCLGVQWHPENFYRTGEFRPLFEAFVEACRRPPSSPP
jgi:putative glutamine amidotransferase